MKKSRRSCRGIDGKKRGAEENARKNEKKWQVENSLHEVVSFPQGKRALSAKELVYDPCHEQNTARMDFKNVKTNYNEFGCIS